MPIWTLWAAWLAVVMLSLLVRSRLYAAFSGVVLGLVTLSWSTLTPTWREMPWLQPQPGGLLLPVALLQLATWLHFLSLMRPRLRSLPFRLLITWPGLWMIAGSWLALPWALVALVGLPPFGWWLPYLAATYGLWESLHCRLETVQMRLHPQPHPANAGAQPRRVEVSARAGLGALEGRGADLRIAHLTDAHLGALVSVDRLRRACQRIVEAQPDLVAITGDFLTMESQSGGQQLTRALEPLAELSRVGVPVFACLGNHDLEAPLTVESACRAAGIELLVDRSVVWTGGTTQRPVTARIVGLDYRFPESTEQLQERLGQTFEQLPAAGGRAEQVRTDLVLALAHAPSSFRRLVPVLENGTTTGSGPPTLTLSGHLHGGQLGLLRFGVDWTVLRLARRTMFEHGLWRLGRHHLYSSRGFGHYGFPLRIGVPAELSVLEINLD